METNTNNQQQSIDNKQTNKQTDKVACCPKCKKKVSIKLNRRSNNTWKCYFCYEEFDTPVARSKDYFNEIVGYKNKKVRMKDEEGRIIEGEYVTQKIPIRRGKKRSFTDDDLITREQLKKQLKDMYNDILYMKNPTIPIRNLAFLSFLFLTGCRIEEVVGMKAVDNEGKRISNRYDVEPLKKNQIYKMLYKKKDIVLWNVKNLPILKRRIDDKYDEESQEMKRDVPRRNVSLLLENEKEFVDYIDKWLIRLKDDDYVFNFSREHAWRICYRFNKSYNHFWRHVRASDLVATYNFQSTQLKHFFGWATEQQAQRYSHLTTSNLVDSMLIGLENQAEKIE